MSQSELADLIQFHMDALSQHRLFMNPSVIYLEEQTIKALKELQQHREGELNETH